MTLIISLAPALVEGYSGEMINITIQTTLQSSYPGSPATTVNDLFGFGTTTTTYSTDITAYGNTLYTAVANARSKGATCELRFAIQVDQDTSDPTVAKVNYQVVLADSAISSGTDIANFLSKYTGIAALIDAGFTDVLGE